jgi:hypothetical protein
MIVAAGPAQASTTPVSHHEVTDYYGQRINIPEGKYNDDGASPGGVPEVPSWISCEKDLNEFPVIGQILDAWNAFAEAQDGKSLGAIYRGEIPGAGCVDSATGLTRIPQGRGNGIPHPAPPRWLKKAEQGSRNRLQGE